MFSETSYKVEVSIKDSTMESFDKFLPSKIRLNLFLDKTFLNSDKVSLLYGKVWFSRTKASA